MLRVYLVTWVVGLIIGVFRDGRVDFLSRKIIQVSYRTKSNPSFDSAGVHPTDHFAARTSFSYRVIPVPESRGDIIRRSMF